MSKQDERHTDWVEAEKALLSRRRFLQGAAGIAGLATFAHLAAACGAPAAPAATAPAAEAGSAAGIVPKQGGRIVFAAESIGESLEPGLWNGFGIINIVDNLAAYLTRPNSSAVCGLTRRRASSLNPGRSLTMDTPTLSRFARV